MGATTGDAARVDVAPDDPPNGGAGAERRIPALDGVRGIAILMVIVYHFFVSPQTKSTLLLDNVVYKIAEAGWAGVDLFFVLSGFLITGILLDAKGGAGFFHNFYARRVLRIFPVYYAALAILVLLLPLIPWFAHQRATQDAQESQFWFWTYLVNIRVAFQPLAEVGFATGHFWSLAVEEQFYLFWPAVVLLAGRRTLIGVCLACIVGAFALRVVFATVEIDRLVPVLAMSILMPARIDTLAVGALIAVLARDPASLRRLASRAVLPGVLASGAVLLALIVFVDDRGLPPQDYWVQTVGFSALAIFFGAGILAALAAPPGGIIERVLVQPVFTIFGKYSYTLYVVHLPIAVYLLRRYREQNEWQLVAGSDLPARLVFAFVGVSMSLAIAWASWRWFEQPILRLKRYFTYEPAGRERSAASGVADGSSVRAGAIDAPR